MSKKIPDGYICLRCIIKDSSRKKLWRLKKELRKSFGQLIMEWANEKYDKIRWED